MSESLNESQKEFLKNGRDIGSDMEYGVLTRDSKVMLCASQRDAEWLTEQEFADSPGEKCYPGAVVVVRNTTPWRLS